MTDHKITPEHPGATALCEVRVLLEPLDRGMTLKPATQYRDVARRSPPRDNP